jgi:hypothetical protein
MICATCFKMLRGQDGRIWKGTYDLNFNHHTQMKDLRRSADTHCGICRILFAELQTKAGFGSLESSKSMAEEPIGSPFATLESTILLLQTYWIIARLFQLLRAFQSPRRLRELQETSHSETESEEKVAKTMAAGQVTKMDDLPLSITASLRVGQGKATDRSRGSGELYYLTFKLRYGRVRCRRVFALQRTGTKSWSNQHSVAILLINEQLT